MTESIKIIRTNEELKELISYLSDKEYIGFDTETNGLGEEANIIGMSVCADVEIGYYVILSEWKTDQLIDLETKNDAHTLVEALVGKSLIMHNAVFDCAMVRNNYNVDLMPSVHSDTMVMAHLVDENRRIGLKELAVSIFGEDSKDEQTAMKESVTKNGGKLTKDHYELFKADGDLIAKYGAKDAILTLKLFYHLVPQLYEQGLDMFYYEDESMPLLRGPTYDLNTSGLPIDSVALQETKRSLETECAQLLAQVEAEITPLVRDKYPNTSTKDKFSISSNQQMGWLLFDKLGLEFRTLTEQGKELCKYFNLPMPYSNLAKRNFIQACRENKNRVWKLGGITKTGKKGHDRKISDYWTYMTCGKETLSLYSKKYKWIDKLVQYNKNMKILNTYVIGIESRMKYNVIHPDFKQCGTTSGRYSCSNPNFQNLPRDNKPLKSCIVSGPGKVFVGADYSQLEPRVFASISGDERLLECFESGDDFYSVIGVEVFDKFETSLKKDDANSFAKLHPNLRNISKVVALSATYGTTAPKMAPAIGKSIDEAKQIIDNYFEKFPKVKEMMIGAHRLAMKEGQVKNLFGRPRRIPEAKNFEEIYGDTEHENLPYKARNTLNLAVNHTIQSTAASIVNRASIAVWKNISELAKTDKRWKEVHLVCNVHDEVILRGPESLASEMVSLLKSGMETTIQLPGVKLVAEPKIAKSFADLK